MAADGSSRGGFNRAPKGAPGGTSEKKKGKTPEKSRSHKQFDQYLAIAFEHMHGRKPSFEEIERLSGHMDVAEKEKLAEAGMSKATLKIYEEIANGSHIPPVAERDTPILGVDSPRELRQVMQQAVEGIIGHKTHQRTTPDEEPVTDEVDRDAPIEEARIHSERAAPAVERNQQELAKAISRIRQDIASGNPNKIYRAERELEEMEQMLKPAYAARVREMGQNAKLAAQRELLQARYKSKKEREHLLKGAVMAAGRAFKSAKGKSIDDLERTIVQEVVAFVNADLERKGAGTSSNVKKSTGIHGGVEGTLLGLNAGLVFSETTTTGAIFTFLAQALTGTTLILTAANPLHWAVYLLCAGTAVAAAPLLEMVKEKGFFEPIAVGAYRKELAKIRAKEDGKPLPKSSKWKHALAALAVGSGGAGAIAVTQAPQVHMMAAVFTSGGETQEFAEDTEAAAVQARDELGRIISPRAQGENAEGVATFVPGPLPQGVSDFGTAFDETCLAIVNAEVSGATGGASGGSGQPYYGPAAALKDYLCYGSLAHAPEGATNAYGASVERARELRSHFRYQQTNPDGTPVVDGEGNPIYVDIALEEGQSMREWTEARYYAFESKANEIFSQAIAKMDLTLEEKDYIVENYSTLNLKLNLFRFLILNPGGFKGRVEELETAIREVESAYDQEFVRPSRGLTEGLAGALRTVSAGDSGIELEVQAANLDLSLLDKITPPASLNPLDTSYEEKLFREGHLSSQALFLAFVLLIALSWAGKSTASVFKAKHQARIGHVLAKDLFGADSYKQGQEFMTAESICADLKRRLTNKNGLFNAESIKEFLPFGDDTNWFQGDSEFLLFMMRLTGEKAGDDFTTESAWPAAFAKKYQHALSNMKHGTVTAPEFAILSGMNARYRNKEVLLTEMYKEILPGFFELMFYSKEITTLKEQLKRGTGGNESSFDIEGKLDRSSIEFFNVFTEMVMEHLELRIKYAHTKLDYYKQVYTDLQKKGEWSELGIEGIADLPTITYDLLSQENVSKTDKDALEGVRVLGFRAAVISEIEQGRAKELAALEEIRGFLDKIDTAAEERIARRTPSFMNTLTRLRSSLDRNTVPIKGPSDEHIFDKSARGGLQRIMREQLENKIKARVLEMRANTQSTDKEYSIEEQLRSARETLEYADKVAELGSRWSFFVNDPRLGKYTCNANTVLRPQGYKDAIAEYYALAFSVTEKGKEGKGPILFEGEMPVELIFAKELSPIDVQDKLGEWIHEHQEEVSTSVKLFALKEEIQKLQKEVTTPAELNLLDERAEDDFKRLFNETLPQARRQSILRSITLEVKGIEDEFKRLQGGSRSTRRIRVRHEERTREFNATFIKSLQRAWKAEEDIERLKRDTGKVYEGQSRRVARLFAALGSRRKFLQNNRLAVSYIPPDPSKKRNSSGLIRINDRRTFRGFSAPKQKSLEMSVTKFEDMLYNPLNEDEKVFKRAVIELLEQDPNEAKTDLTDNRTDERLAA